MNRRARTILFLVLALASSGAGLEPARAASATPATPVSVLAVQQSHGFVTRPSRPTGYLVHVRGAAGTRYEVWLTPSGGAPSLFTYGEIPPGGSITTAMHVPGVGPNPHTEKVEVTSRSDARVQVTVRYD
jgi:hypothetical protein